METRSTLKSTVSPLAAFNATNNSLPFGETKEPIEIVGVIVGQGPDMPDQITHEPHTTTQTFFLAKDGKTYQSLAEGVARGALQLMAQFGAADEWPDRLTVQLHVGKSNKGNKVLTITLGQAAATA